MILIYYSTCLNLKSLIQTSDRPANNVNLTAMTLNKNEVKSSEIKQIYGSNR